MERANVASAKIEAVARGDESSSLAPFRDRAFAALWTATVVSNIGTWMQSAAAGWLPFWRRLKDWEASGGGTELSSGRSSRICRRKAVFSKRSNLTPGLSICASTSGSLTPDREQQELVHHFQLAGTAKVTHLIAAFRR
jgi:hypothetical protein